ncbi:complement component C1q receptor-like [Pelobates fuscus]|uniref:complement component C1q receptor-like n=1 Tax=Pelobates fuscus TaxID=191477 RepID=UPI002FE47FBF
MVLPQLKLIFLAVLLLLLLGTHADDQSHCVNNVCYTVHLGKQNFQNAKDKCIYNGGDLVTIKSQEEAEHVKNLLLQLNSSLTDTPLKLWIGLQLNKNKCYVPHKLLKGFSLVTGDKETEESQFSNWMQEPKSTCTQVRCVTIHLDFMSTENYKWLDGKCINPVDGYLCKFQFKGMCKPVALAGPGNVEYFAPIEMSTASLSSLPHGSMATIRCEDNSVSQIVCKEHEDGNGFHWDSEGPLCASPNLGCDYNNGGCEQECIRDLITWSVRCGCRDGYVLASDLISCVLPQNCQSNPCQHRCTNSYQGYECTCIEGYELSENKLNCTDIDECQQKPCQQVCTNTLGSFECSCKTGYMLHDNKCLDQDECINSPCEHGCLNTDGSFYCSCKYGYEVGNDRLSCHDVDECTKSPCAEMCSNVPGSYVCFCPDGFLLSSDGISCYPDTLNQNTNTSGQVGQEMKPKGNQTINSFDNTDHSTTSSMSPDSLKDASVIENTIQLVTSPMTSEFDSSSGDELVDKVSSDQTPGHRTLILVSTICACGVLLLLAVVAGIVCYKRRNSEKEDDYKPPSATDNYCWVPEQSENKVPNNEYGNDFRR